MELVEISDMNIRGFCDATLPLGNEKALIVGRTMLARRQRCSYWRG